MLTHIDPRHDRAELDLATFAVQLLQTVHDPVVVWDAAGYPVTFSNACLEVFGYSADEFSALNRSELTHPDQPREFADSSAVREHRIVDWSGDRLRLRSRQKETIEVECNSIEIQLRDGSPATLVTYKDVTALTTAQAAVRRHEQLNESLVENIGGVVFTTGSDNRFVTANHIWLELLGIGIQELRTKTLAELVHPGHQARTLQTREARNVGRNVNSFVLPVRTAGGRLLWIDLDLHSVIDEAGQLLGMQGFGRDVSDEHEERERLLTEASTDALTGLANRRQFDEFLEQQVASAIRFRTPLSLVTLDLDRFKRLNDRYGHPAGDEVLRALADVLSHAARASDLAARYGGEEFALVLPDADAAGALKVAEHCVEAIRSVKVPFDGQTIGVTASLGVATFNPAIHRDANGLLLAADKAVYAAKDAGRNTVRVEARQAD